ncbi:putative udp-glucuronosyltransferase 2a3 [Phaeomoniella chlamydospora]|uniref:UDP-glycosyltransferase 2 n=1 Tax=Phaeomoniella chlamydospora TaxID=158046 RepID=OGT2_PHACM|nr:putative udp-glucuronosyltransferase 2a3 [Phaeomoniella chlamydospora]
MIASTAKPHVILAAVPIYGHVEKLRIIGCDLQKRGYAVTFLTGTVWREFVEHAGLPFFALKANADFDGRDFAKAFPMWDKLPPGPPRFGYLRHSLIDQMPAQHESVQAVLEDVAARGLKAVVIQDTAFFGVNPIQMGAPGITPAGTITVGITPLPLFSIDTAPFGSGLPPDSSPEGRARNIAANEKIKAVAQISQAHFTQTMKSLGVKTVPDDLLNSAVTTPDRFLQLCIESFEYPRSDAPSNLRYIGALAPGDENKSQHPLPDWWDLVIKHDKPLVVVSQGTLSNHNYKDLIIPTLEALKDLDIRVVTTLVRTDSLDGDLQDFQIPSNVLVAKFIPFEELFKHADLVVNNGGYGTVQTAFGHGVPMVLAGQTEDKTETNARAAWSGAAINLACQTATAEQVRDAVEKVLNDPKYKNRAMELKKEYEACDALQSIADNIDELAAAAAAEEEDENE